MNIQFENWQAFWSMGGYGFFVWLSFGISLLAVFAVVLESIWTKKQLIKAVNAQIARKQRIKQRQQQEKQDATEQQKDSISKEVELP